jgi:ABC-2 type transport system ATP-binding protein
MNRTSGHTRRDGSVPAVRTGKPAKAASDSVIVENLVRKFGKFTAVDGISFRVRDGEIFGFLGANGAGKTTTIRMLAGLLAPTSGRATVEGFDIATQSDGLKEHIGYMSQKFSLYDDLTVHENLEFSGGMHGLEGAAFHAALESAAAFTGLETLYGRFPREIPLGWKQRLALTAAMLHNPRLLFLDEPTGGVDPVSRREFWRLIQDLAEGGTTIFVTTHYMDEAEYCNRLSIMHDGVIVAMGSPAELKASGGWATMEDAFVELVSRRLASA